MPGFLHEECQSFEERVLDLVGCHVEDENPRKTAPGEQLEIRISPGRLVPGEQLARIRRDRRFDGHMQHLEAPQRSRESDVPGSERDAAARKIQPARSGGRIYLEGRAPAPVI